MLKVQTIQSYVSIVEKKAGSREPGSHDFDGGFPKNSEKYGKKFGKIRKKIKKMENRKKLEKCNKIRKNTPENLEKYE